MKSGGMDRGARVVTWNSSGASRERPNVRVTSDPPHDERKTRPAIANPGLTERKVQNIDIIVLLE
jgi:hypothetical protein